MKIFIFESYDFTLVTKTAEFTYSFDHETFFTEKVVFAEVSDYDKATLDRALFLSFILVGVSYCKLFPRVGIEWRSGAIDAWQAEFLNKVYQEGLSQYAYENDLTRQNLAQFTANADNQEATGVYTGSGILSLQSGGKDSLLTAESLHEQSKKFDSFYVSNSGAYPDLLNTVGSRLLVARRYVDIEAIKRLREQGALNGHVPVTYIVLSFALIQAILVNKQTVLASIGHEGEEPHAWVGDLPVNHQWSKTWSAEVLLSEYVKRYIAPTIEVGSPLRQFTELRIAELFIQKAWPDYGHSFSSCNIANYQIGNDNSQLKWCGNCPKCANSYLLFAPFLEPKELQSIFNEQDLFTKVTLQDTFKGLLGIDDVMKPFECVGETDELRLAYHMAQKCGGYGRLSFKVPTSSYNYLQKFPAQAFSDLRL